MDAAATDELRQGGERKHLGLTVLIGPTCPGLQAWIWMQVFPAEILDLVHGEVLGLKPGAPLYAHHGQPRLSKHLCDRTSGGPGTHNADVHSFRLASVGRQLHLRLSVLPTETFLLWLAARCVARVT
jgi:hypothetical protein